MRQARRGCPQQRLLKGAYAPLQFAAVFSLLTFKQRTRFETWVNSLKLRSTLSIISSVLVLRVCCSRRITALISSASSSIAGRIVQHLQSDTNCRIEARTQQSIVMPRIRSGMASPVPEFERKMVMKVAIFVAGLAVAISSIAPANAAQDRCSSTTWPMISPVQCRTPKTTGYVACLEGVRKLGWGSEGA